MTLTHVFISIIALAALVILCALWIDSRAIDRSIERRAKDEQE